MPNEAIEAVSQKLKLKIASVTANFILGPSPFKQRNLKGGLKGYLKGGLKGGCKVPLVEGA